MTSGWINTETIATMAKERESPPFDVRAMAIAHHGSEKDLRLKEKFMLEMSRDPNFYAVDIHDLTKDQIRQRTMAKIGTLVHYVTNEPIDEFQKRMEVVSMFDPGLWTRLGVHFGLFVGAIVSCLSDVLLASWASAKRWLTLTAPTPSSSGPPRHRINSATGWRRASLAARGCLAVSV